MLPYEVESLQVCFTPHDMRDLLSLLTEVELDMAYSEAAVRLTSVNFAGHSIFSIFV